MHVLSCVQLFAILWIGAHQAPVSMEFSRKEYWGGLPFSTPGNLPDPGIEPASLVSPALAGDFFFFFKPLTYLGNPSKWHNVDISVESFSTQRNKDNTWRECPGAGVFLSMLNERVEGKELKVFLERSG